MLSTTLPYLSCPRRKRRHTRCGGTLTLNAKETSKKGSTSDAFEVRSGELKCTQCHSKFPILAGVAVLVDDVRLYLLHHVKGITQAVPDSEIPREYLHDFLEAKAEIQIEHIEEDLEAKRVIALYLMNHYLRTSSADAEPWWKPRKNSDDPGSPLVDSLVRQYWDQGPFMQIKKWIIELEKSASTPINLMELGCGVGGLYPALKDQLGRYLGMDSSFASIALARHFTLGVPYSGSIGIPEDLLSGPVSRPVRIPIAETYDGRADFVLGDFEAPPLKSEQWNVSVALNAIDMLDDPSSLPKLQHQLLQSDGTVIQSCPYIWHESVAKRLRKKLPQNIKNSARAVEWLYQQTGFEIQEKLDHLPWLFFKHCRQLEIYSVHLFTAKKKT